MCFFLRLTFVLLVDHASERKLFGTQEQFRPVAPSTTEFVFTIGETCKAPPPSISVSLREPPVEPPDGHYYPLAPAEGYVLQEDRRYRRNYAFITRCNISKEFIRSHGNLLMVTATPPNVEPELIDGIVTTKPIPGMVRMIPGVPYASHFDGDPARLHTIGCLQTLQSLSHYPDFDEVLTLSVKLAKLTWGCPARRNSPKIDPLYSLPGLKVNDRSKSRQNMHHGVYDGSYNLAHTVMKGEGLGTVLPAVQADTPAAKSQIMTVLNILNRLYRLVMPKCLSKFEFEIVDFHCTLNNVFNFGGLDPSGTSVQLNVSSLGKSLENYIGTVQGGWHIDRSDDPLKWTLFVLLLRVGPSKCHRRRH